MEGNRMDILFRKDRKTNEVVAFIPESTVCISDSIAKQVYSIIGKR